MRGYSLVQEIKEILKCLQNSQNDEVNLFVIRTSKLKNERLFEVLKPEITINIGDMLLKNTRLLFEKLLKNDDLIIKNYQPGIKYERFVVERIQLDDVETLKYIAETSVYEVDHPSLSREDYKFLWSYHYTINHYLFFRIISNKKLLKQVSGFLLIFKDNNFNDYTKEFLIIDEEIDFIIDTEKKVIYIFNKYNFERLSSFYEKWKEEVKKRLPNFYEKIKINNEELFEERYLGDLRKVRKLHNIMNSQVYKIITTNVIKRIKEDFNLSIEFSEDGKEILVEKTNDWDLLKALDDDHLTSKYTNYNYEVQYKTKKNN